MQTIVLVELLVYLAAMLGIGLYYARREMSQADFHLGGKKLPGWALALSERSTGESAWCVLGLTGFAFSSGLSAVWIAVGCVAGITTAWFWLAREFRRERDRYDVLTLPDYLAVKYPERGRIIRWLSSLIVLCFFLFYVSAQFSGSGKTLEVTFHLDSTWGILISAAVVILYSMAGGFFSVVWTDAVQALLMILSLGLLPVLALLRVLDQGIPLQAALTAAGGGRDSWTGGLTGFAMGLMIFNNLGWFFGYLGGQPQLSSRWMAMRTDADVRTGAWIAVAWTFVAYAGAIVIGLTGLALYGAGAVDDAEKIFPYMVTRMLPPWLGGILLTGAVAAMMSTASSQLLISASCVSQDILCRSLGRSFSERTLVAVSRVTVAVVGLLGLLLAFTAKDLIYYVVGWAWAGIGCSFSPVILLAFFWRRFHANGVVAGLVAGLVFTVVWTTSGMDKLLTARAATFFVSLACAVGATLLTPRRGEVPRTRPGAPAER